MANTEKQSLEGLKPNLKDNKTAARAEEVSACYPKPETEKEIAERANLAADLVIKGVAILGIAGVAYPHILRWALEEAAHFSLAILIKILLVTLPIVIFSIIILVRGVLYFTLGTTIRNSALSLFQVSPEFRRRANVIGAKIRKVAAFMFGISAGLSTVMTAYIVSTSALNEQQKLNLQPTLQKNSIPTKGEEEAEEEADGMLSSTAAANEIQGDPSADVKQSNQFPSTETDVPQVEDMAGDNSKERVQPSSHMQHVPEL